MKKTVSIRKLLEQTVPFSLMGSDIRCEFEVSESLWNVDADESQMNQVIQNIIINAKQAMPEGGSVGVSAENIVIERDLIEKAPMKKGRYVKISIRDSGIGISKNLLAKIFDPYFTTKETGSGLGLAITHSIVQKHGGSIAVESRQGQGTTFHIYLPASFSEIPARDERPVNWVRGNGKILVIDDEGAILQVTAEMLTRLGFESKAVRTGSEAIEIFRESEESGSPFDLVITDLTIPGDIGGIGILQKIRQINPEAKVIVTSGYSNDPVLSDYQGKGFSFFIAKPFTLSDISDAIKRLLPGP